jgi:potassium efflux system protein
MRNRLTTSLLTFFMLVAAPLFGQELLLNAVDSESVTVEQIESAISVVESRQGLDAETRGIVIEYLLDAQVQIQSRRGAEAAAATYAASLETAPEETAALRTSLDEESLAPPTAESLGIDESTTLAELEQRLAQETANLTALDSQLAELKDQVEVELGRPAAVSDRIDRLRKSREALAGIVNTHQIQGEQQIVANARKFSAQLTRAAQGAEIGKLEQELLSHAVRLSLLQAQRDVAARMQLKLGPRVDLLRAATHEQLQAAAVQAQESADAAELALADKHPVLRGLAEDNAELTRELPQRAAATQVLDRQLERTKSEVSYIEQRLARSERQLEIGGLSRALGSLLIAERRSLPPLSVYRTDFRARDRDAANVGLDRIRVQEQRRELASLDQTVQTLVAEMGADISDPDELATNGSEIRPLLLARRDLLLQLENSYGNYLLVLANLDTEQRHLLDSTEKYQQFLAKNLLWIPSAPIIGSGIVRNGLPAYPQVLKLGAWAGVATLLAESVGQHVVASLFCLALLFSLLLIRKPLARQYTSMSKRVGRLSSDSIVLTLASLAIVAIRVLPLPFLMYSVAWFLDNASQPSTFSDSVARCFFLTTPFIYNVLLFNALSAPGGIFSLHFGWQQDSLLIIRRQLRRLAFIGAPLIFATALLFLSEMQSDRATLGRIVFLALMFFLSSVSRPLLHPDTGIVARHYQRFAGTWTARLRWLWFGVGMGLPLLLAVISCLGFLYTSTILAGLLVDTFWRVLGLVVLYLIVLRWLALARRKLALQLALKDREARRAEKQNEAESEDNSDAAPVAEVPLDLDEVDQQARKLLRAVMIVVAVIVGWNIWADVLPAFSFLNEVGLWTQTVMVDGVETILPVTLADLMLAVLVIVVTAIASKNLPGLMEILILQRLTLEPGSHYAINTLIRYFVVTVGTFSVLNLIGWNWGQIQWLVAALSVGLGFGLQEIVANFVSGLIILFERPIRVGDTVTVGDLTGTVSRVRIRATTITDWDRKEILVPNKSFITGQVINWTLSDPITRIVIPVGVAYGSDAVLTQKVMFDTLISLPLVLDEPPPKVYFTGFGDSSLNFTLHAYLRQLSDRLPLVHEVHEAILKALRENGIEIPFPQRDIHIRSTVEDS